jgi:eukaryotic-like serine/threonine-protein kinase
MINDRYEALDVLGRGGQGVVYRGRDRWMDREVAIKVLGSKAARAPQVAERLMREQQALSALKGTAAVEVLDICRGKDGELCLVMELLTGTDLENHLYALEERKELIAPAEVAEIFDPIVDTLEVAHNAGIVHRDLKPANVFLLESGGVRLLDFGMARLRKGAPLTAAGTVMGSPSFMAPEAWKGQSELVDHRADLYSLGVILFRVLAGELPFSGASLQQKFLGTTSSARPSLVAKRPDLPPDADEWVTVALAIDREQRFQTVRALWNAFLTALDVESPKRRPWRASLWAAAKQAVKTVAGSAEKQPPDRPRLEPSGDRREPSFGAEALARSMMAPLTPPLRDSDASAPRPKPVPRRPAPAVETTLELTDSDLAHVTGPSVQPGSVEKTLELDDADLHLGEDTLPEKARPKPPPRRPRQ